MNNTSEKLGTKPVRKLLLEMALPATIGMLVMVVYNVTDTVFVSKFVGPYAVGGMSIVSPITMLISVLGMAIGIGGGTFIAKSLGERDKGMAKQILGNMVLLSFFVLIVPTVLCYFYELRILKVFGATGQLLPYAQDYYRIVIFGAPLLGWAMMLNNALRSEGKAKETMLTMFLSALMNIGLDWYLILGLDMGIEGAAIATVASQFVSLIYVLALYVFKYAEVELNFNGGRLESGVVKKILSIGGTSVVRQGTFSLLAIVVNQTLLIYDGTFGVAVYGVLNRIIMMAIFPIFGIAQGMMPIVSYNLGAKLYSRVKDVLFSAVGAATIVSSVLFGVLYFFTEEVMFFFTNDVRMLRESVAVLKIVILFLPAVGLQILGSVYFQAIGKAKPALLLTLSRQLFFLVPSVWLLPKIFGTVGVWYAFPLADLASTLLTLFILFPSIGALKRLGEKT